MVSQKDLRILDYLFDCLEKKQSAKTDQIAEKFSVSTRTVRSNIDRIDYYLKSKGYPCLTRSRKEGISLDILPSDIDKAKKDLLTVSTSIYALSKEERILLIKLLLFDTSGYLTYDYISQLFSVSRKTVIEDVRLLKDECRSWEVDVPGTKYGICLQGRETDIRRLLLDSMLSAFRPVELWEILRDIYPNRSVAIEKKWRAMVSSKTTRICEEELLSADDSPKSSITDVQYYLTIILTALSIKRCSQNRTVDDIFPEQGTIRSIPLLNNYFQRLEKRLSWTFPEAEKTYIASQLSSLFHFEGSSSLETFAEALTGNLLLSVSQKTGTDYSNDPQLQDGLHSHIFSLAKNSFVPYQDPGEEFHELIGEHPDLYQAIVQTLSDNSDLAFRIDPHTEAAFVLLHFLAADERRRCNGRRVYRTFIVCNNGVGTSSIVTARIQVLFPQIQVLGSSSLRRAEELVSNLNPDFIITTVPFETTSVPVIQVSASIPEGDQRKLELFLNGRNSLSDRPEHRKSKWEELMTLINTTCTIHNLPSLENGLTRILGLSAPVKSDHLSSLLTEDMIQLDVAAKDWEEAIRLSAKPLLSSNRITTGYIDAMIRNVHTTGPYIVVTKGIAMPHAQTSDGALTTCMSLSVLKDPVCFGHSANDPVRLIFCFAVAEQSRHMNIMSELVNFISNKENIRKLLSANSRQDILRIVRSSGEDIS